MSEDPSSTPGVDPVEQPVVPNSHPTGAVSVEDQANVANQANANQAYQQVNLTNISSSRGFARWLMLNQVSLALTSYQTGQLFLVGVTPEGGLSIHQRNFVRAMGIYADGSALYLAGLAHIWRLQNVLGPDQRANGHFDRLYIPRAAQTVADVDAHEMVVESNGRLIFVNTRYSCLATVSNVHSFKPVWRPKFISRLAPEDRCHLNGVCLEDGRVRYVTAVSTTDIVDGWRGHRGDGGVLIDVDTDEILLSGLSMPHSPRVYNGHLWLLDSGNGYLTRIDRQTWQREQVAFCPGFMRGLALHRGHAVIALSMPRDGRLTGLALEAELAKRGGESWCGVQIVNLENGDIVEWLRFDGAIRELFDIQLLPGVSCPMAVEAQGPDLASFVSIEAPDRPLDERGWDRAPAVSQVT